VPNKPPTVCCKPGCRGLVRNGTCNVCGTSGRTPDIRPPAATRGYDQQWRGYVKVFRRAHPLCALCEAEGRLTPTEIVHHLDPVADGNPALCEAERLLAVCRQCHERVEGLGDRWQTVVTAPGGHPGGRGSDIAGRMPSETVPTQSGSSHRF
jgi:5-methylcytosine-specific restriction enzyme A